MSPVKFFGPVQKHPRSSTFKFTVTKNVNYGSLDFKMFFPTVSEENYVNFMRSILLGFKAIKWRILNQTGKIGTGKNTKSLYFLLG